jgi:nucleotide-binding universal stress UspA family protein
MFSTVIAGVDGFDGGRDAVALARVLADGDGVTLVSAYPADTIPSRASLAGYETLMHDDALRILHAVRDEAGLADTAALVAVPDASPARALQHLAHERDADLIVVGSAHHGALTRVVLGDVGRGVLHGAPCPVAVAPKRFRGAAPRTVAVGFDGSPEAEAALALARAYADEHGAGLTVLVAWQEPQMPVALAGAGPVLAAELVEDARQGAERLLSDTLATLPHTTAGLVLRGRADIELTRAADAFELLVIGSRGWGPAHRIALGSVSDHLVHHAPCPVVVVPRPASKPARAMPETPVAAVSG